MQQVLTNGQSGAWVVGGQPHVTSTFVTAGTFDTRQRHEGLRATTVTRIVTLGGPFPVTVGTCQTPRPHEGPKVLTVARIATHGRPIPLTVGTVETRREHEMPKVTTVTGTAALRRQKRQQL